MKTSPMYLVVCAAFVFVDIAAENFAGIGGSKIAVSRSPFAAEDFAAVAADEKLLRRESLHGGSREMTVDADRVIGDDTGYEIEGISQVMDDDAVSAPTECACKTHNKCWESLRELILKLDLAGNGHISKQEWTLGAHKYLKCSGTETGGTASHVFTALNKNCNDYLEQSELTCLAEVIGKAKDAAAATCEALYTALPSKTHCVACTNRAATR